MGAVPQKELMEALYRLAEALGMVVVSATKEEDGRRREGPATGSDARAPTALTEYAYDGLSVGADTGSTHEIGSGGLERGIGEFLSRFPDKYAEV